MNKYGLKKNLGNADALHDNWRWAAKMELAD
jgi:hypothetical protein